MNKMKCFVSFTGFVINRELRVEIGSLCHAVQERHVHKLSKPHSVMIITLNKGVNSPLL